LNEDIDCLTRCWCRSRG